MNTTHDQTWTAIVAVRVPRDSSIGLPDAACCRLEAADGIRAVDLNGVRGIDPALAATVVTVEVTVHARAESNDKAVTDRLAHAPGSQRVDALERD